MKTTVVILLKLYGENKIHQDHQIGQIFLENIMQRKYKHNAKKNLNV